MDQRVTRSLLAILIIVIIAIFIAWAGSQGSYAIGGIPIFALGIALAFIINWIAFIPAYLRQTEKFFDLVGSITYLSVIWVSFLLTPETDSRSILLVGIISIWAIRLGTFLFRRIRKAGEDRRFTELKTSFARFLATWTIQGLWVSLTVAAALAAITSTQKVSLDGFAIIGFIVWLTGFGFEVVADRQKSAFNAEPQNAGKFISTGLWSWSRHPNYFGEIVLWIGVAIIAIPTLQGWQWITMISPLFVVLLLTRVSGIPMLEKRADEKWGGQPDYETYKASTSILVPRPPSN